MKSILIVDDEEKIRDVVSSYLEREGYQVREAKTGSEALEIINQYELDLVILDLMLPDISGEEICQQIRKILPVPILMLTAKLTEEDRVLGLSLGADDYMTKPFSVRELVARVKAILRRCVQDLLADRIIYNHGNLIIDAVSHQVFKSGEIVNLTTNEYKLLLALSRHPKRVFTRDELINKVLGFDFTGDARTIDQHIKNLRQKIEEDPKTPRYIATIRGMGYTFTGGENA